MPTIELIKGDRRLDAEGREAHLLRTRDRITAQKAKLDSLEPDATRAPGRISWKAEADLIGWELGVLEQQLTDPRTKRSLLAEGKIEPCPVTTDLTAIKSQVKEQDGARQEEAQSELLQGLALMVKSLREELAQLKERNALPQSQAAAQPS